MARSVVDGARHRYAPCTKPCTFTLDCTGIDGARPKASTDGTPVHTCTGGAPAHRRCMVEGLHRHRRCRPKARTEVHRAPKVQAEGLHLGASAGEVLLVLQQ